MPLLLKTQQGILKVCESLCCISRTSCLFSQSKAALPDVSLLFSPITAQSLRMNEGRRTLVLLFENIFSNVSCREDALQYNFVFNLAISVK